MQPTTSYQLPFARIFPATLGLAFVVLFWACGRMAEPAPEPEAPAAPTGPSKPAPTRPPESDLADVEAQMRSHYEAAVEARDAVIRGDVDRAKGALASLSSRAYTESLPDAWRPYAVHVRRAAKTGAEARDMEGAALAVAALGAACGDCHTAIGKGPERTPSGFSELTEEDLRTQMHRHGWALERMWEGLMVPWDDAYRIGAQVLAEGKLAGEEHAEGEEHAAGLSAVRALGRKAKSLGPGLERATIYASLIATCAPCHRSKGVKLDAPEAP